MNKKRHKKADPKRMSHSELEALSMAYESALLQLEQSWSASDYNGHTMLLKEHAVAMAMKLQKMLGRWQEKYTLTLTAVEAMAMYQLWQLAFDLDAFSGNAVRKIQGIIHQKHVSATWVTPQRRLLPTR